MKEYTIDIHAERLSRMLEKKNVCRLCPKRQGFRISNYNLKSYSLMNICRVCTSFVGISSTYSCPCIRLGPEEAISRSHKALKEYYETRT